MKIALLLADHIPAYRQKLSGGDYPEMFSKMFLKIDVLVDIDYFDITINEYPKNIEIYDGFIISGSKFSAYDDIEWIHVLKKYIQLLYLQKKTVIGVCFGHQIIAETLGGKVKKSTEKGWGLGVQTIKIQKNEIWMNPVCKYLSLIFYHQDQVVKIPNNGKILGSNKFCEIQMYHIDNHILGIQAHPEMLRDHNHLLIKEYSDLHGPTIVKTAIDTLRLRDHGLKVAMWINNLLELNRIKK